MSDQTYRGVVFGIFRTVTGWHATITTGTVEFPWETQRGPFLSAPEAEQEARALIDEWLNEERVPWTT